MTIVRQAAVLVGGLGTRLGARTASVPKPLLAVGGRPFLSWVLRELCRYGIEEVLLLAGHRAEAVLDALPDLRRRLPRPMTLRVLTEAAPAGTAGALALARDSLDEKFLLCNGDTVVDGSLAPLIAAAAADPPEVAGRLLLARVADADRFGQVSLAGDRVERFAERGTGAGWVSAGIAVLSRDLPAGASLERDVLPNLAAAGRLRATTTEAAFLDIGIPEDFSRAETWVGRLRRPALFLDRDGVLNRDFGHVGSVGRLEWIPDAPAAVALANRHGWSVFVVTNQSGVARALYAEADVAGLHRHMQDVLLTEGAGVDDWRYCPHHPQGTVAAYAVACDCRKPAPGMLRALLTDWEVGGRSALVGDRATDLEAAAALGIPGVLFDGRELVPAVRAAMALAA